MRKRNFITILLGCILIGCYSCTGQQYDQKTKAGQHSKEVVGGPFENSGFFYINMPDQIAAIDTSPGWKQPGQRLQITGKILKRDGKTAVPGVILYYYHTDINGYYASNNNLDKRVIRHGYIRGWVKSDAKGNYAIYTVRPASYPNRSDPAHIHPAIKEQGIDNPYYLDEFVFDDDKLLTAEKRKAMENRGGSGVLRVSNKGDLQVAEHNIILGLNIPNYPAADGSKDVSGRSIGEDVLSFTPFHVWGPDKGTHTCPVCKYGRGIGILYFTGSNPQWSDVKEWLSFLETQSIEKKKKLKVYYINSTGDVDAKAQQILLEHLGNDLHLKQVAITTVPSFNDTQSGIDQNKINATAINTFIIYKNSNIIDKYINLRASGENKKMIAAFIASVNQDFLKN